MILPPLVFCTALTTLACACLMSCLLSALTTYSLAEYTQPALTTVAVPRAEVGKTAFEALWTMLHDPELKGREDRLGMNLIVDNRRRRLLDSGAKRAAALKK